MSLAMSAAPYNMNNNDTSISDTPKNKGGHNRTQKRQVNRENVDTDKVNGFLEAIHNMPAGEENDDSEEMGEFNPPSPPVSSGVERTLDAKESPAMDYLRGDNEKNTSRSSPVTEGYNSSALEMNNFQKNYGSQQANAEYYKQFNLSYPPVAQQPPSPAQAGANRPYYSYPTPGPQQPSESNAIIEKLNYMIHLLEEQQDERTGSVTEEVILYSFLGIFVIFLVDSFTRVGRYKR